MPHDYTAVTAADVDRVVTETIGEGEAILASVLAVDGERTFGNTLQPFDTVAALVVDAFGRGPFMSHVHPDEAVRDAATAAAERLERWQVELDSRVDLYQALVAYADSDAGRALEGEWARVLKHKLRDFRRAGTDLPPEQREEVERLRGRLVELSVAFQRNIDEYQDGLDLSREELEGLPDSFVARLSPGEKPDTYRVSLDYPERFPFLDQARRRDLRRELYLKSWRIAVDENRPLLAEALEIRGRLAELLGQPDWAHHAMEVRMADPAAVEEFYADLVPALSDKADAELEVMAAMLAEDGGDDSVRPWDTRYYDTQLRRRDFGVDPDEVAEHFPLEHVVEGMFDLTAEVFGLRYEQATEAKAWHEDVFLYEILDADSGEHLAWFYADLFPRKGKFAHAAAWDLVPGHRRDDGSYRRPVAAIVANFPRPSDGSPSLLRHDDVVTLFHEFGHILHQCLTTTESARFAGTNTERDFVEAPSQIMENWCWDAEVLQRFARHHETGAPIPEELVAQLVAARDLNEGLAQLRQCYFGQLDLAFHRGDGERDLDALTRDIFAVTRLPYPEEDTFFPASFGHLMGGYDAGYYGYLWALVYGHDMFSRFEEEGVTNPEVGRAYRQAILERGGSEPALDLVRRFLGREPSNEAFLRRLGIAASS